MNTIRTPDGKYDALKIDETGGYISPEKTRDFISSLKNKTQLREDLERAEKATGRSLACLAAHRSQLSPEKTSVDIQMDNEVIMANKIAQEKKRLAGNL